LLLTFCKICAKKAFLSKFFPTKVKILEILLTFDIPNDHHLFAFLIDLQAHSNPPNFDLDEQYYICQNEVIKIA
jgi:hypothetical protein